MRNLLITALAVSALGVASAQTFTDQHIVLAEGVTNPPTSSANNTRDILFVDVDGDSDLDMISLNNGDVSIIHINDGSGEYPTTANLNGSSAFQCKGIVFEDFTGLTTGSAPDGRPDCIIAMGPTVGANSPQANVFLRNTTTLADSPTFAVIATEGDPSSDVDHSYAVAIVTVGGTVNLIVVNRRLNNGTLGNNRHYTSDGDGTWTTVAGSPIGTSTLSSRDIAVADLDGNGTDDILIANAGNGSSLNECFRSTGGSVFVLDPAGAFSTTESNTYGLAVGHLDSQLDSLVLGTDLPDVVTANRLTASTPEPNRVFANISSIGDIDFSLAVTLDNVTSYDVAIGDLDEDNDNDIVIANRGANNEVLMNNLIDDSLVEGTLNTDGANFFDELDYGVIQSNRGETLSVTLAEVFDYDSGSDNHTGMEVALGNTNSAANFFYRGFGPMFANLGGEQVGSSTALAGSGFLSPTTGAALTLTDPGSPTRAYNLFASLTVQPGAPTFGGSSFLATPVLLMTGNLDGNGLAVLAIPAGSLPVVTEGVWIVFQYIIVSPQSISNAISGMIQGT
jgi:hypothetical protein